MAVRQDRLGRPLRRRKCARCGHVGWFPERQRKCYRPRFGRQSYACWGDLGPVTRHAAASKKVREAVMAMADSAREFEQSMGEVAADVAGKPKRRRKRPQDLAAQRAAHARKMVSQAARRMKSATRSLTLWQRRLREYERRAAMTDEQVAEQSRKIKESFERSRQRNVRRAVDVKREL